MLARHLRWLGPVAVLGLAAALRLWALDRPDSLVFDELYYVRDAVSQLAHGYPTTWPDSEPDFGGERARAFTDVASNAVHPPLGKWLIGLGILALGPDSGWGWRIAVALTGVATVGLTMRLGWLLSRSLTVACLAGFLLAIDGVHVTLSRVGLLDGPLTLAIVIGALCAWRDHEWARRAWARAPGGGAMPAVWLRPWLIAAAAAFGCAAAIKWSGVYPLAAFLVFAAVRDGVLRRRSGVSARPTLVSLAQAVVTGTLSLTVSAIVYLASWAGWILAPGGHARDTADSWWAALANYHLAMFEWHSTLTASHPFSAPPLTWPLDLVPTAMYRAEWGADEGCPWRSGCVSVVSPLPDLPVTWGGVLALVVLLVVAVRAALRSMRVRGPAPASPSGTLAVAAAFVLVGYLSGWLPWLLTVSRSAVFQFYAVVLTPFSALALALVLGALVERRTGAALLPGLDPAPSALLGRRLAVAVFLGVALALALFFFPLWSGMPVPEWFWRLHLWLPDWA